MTRRIALGLPLIATTFTITIASSAYSVSADSKVSVGSPPTPYLPNSLQRAGVGDGRRTTQRCWPPGPTTWSTAPRARAAAATSLPTSASPAIYFSFDSGDDLDPADLHAG